MGRQMGFALAIVLSLAGAASVRAQSEQQQANQPKTEQKREGNKGRFWWNDEKFRVEVGFSTQQAGEIDKVFHEYLERARPLRTQINELDKTIEKMSAARDTDLAIFTHTVEKVEARRAELNKLRTVMLYRMRRVLTAEQTDRFQAAYPRWEAARKKQDGDRRK